MNNPIMRFTVGNASVTRVPETGFSLTCAVLYPDSADALSLSPDTEIELSVHSWLVQLNGLNILVDTGIGNFKERPFSALFHHLNTPFLDRLDQAGVAPDQVDYVLLTHLHTDHVGWNTYLDKGRWRPTFPNARYLAPGKDLEFLFTKQGAARRMLFDDSILPLISHNQLTVIPPEGGEVLPGVDYIQTPGHSVGHMAIRLRANEQTALFSGDIMHEAIQVAVPDVSSTFCFDKDLAGRTRREFLSRAALEEAVIFTAHFGKTSAGRVRRNGNGYAWRYVEPAARLSPASESDLRGSAGAG